MTTLSGTAQPAPAAGLGRHVPGRVIGPGSPDWDSARRPWNRRAGRAADGGLGALLGAS